MRRSAVARRSLLSAVQDLKSSSESSQMVSEAKKLIEAIDAEKSRQQT
jgi:hypothetical protein